MSQRLRPLLTQAWVSPTAQRLRLPWPFLATEFGRICRRPPTICSVAQEAGLLVYAACDPEDYAESCPSSRPAGLFLWHVQQQVQARAKPAVVYVLCLDLSRMEKARAQLRHAVAHCEQLLGVAGAVPELKPDAGLGRISSSCCEWCQPQAAWVKR